MLKICQIIQSYNQKSKCLPQIRPWLPGLPIRRRDKTRQATTLKLDQIRITGKIIQWLFYLPIIIIVNQNCLTISKLSIWPQETRIEKFKWVKTLKVCKMWGKLINPKWQTNRQIQSLYHNNLASWTKVLRWIKVATKIAANPSH